MRIGIDLDDTICNTTKIVQDRVKRYADEEGLNDLDIMNDEVLKQNFFNIYIDDIYSNVEPKNEALKVLRRLKNRGNEIYIITARCKRTTAPIETVIRLTSDWLKKYEIEVDGIITSAYGDSKADVCKRYKIHFVPTALILFKLYGSSSIIKSILYLLQTSALESP